MTLAVTFCGMEKFAPLSYLFVSVYLCIHEDMEYDENCKLYDDLWQRSGRRGSCKGNGRILI